MKYWQLLVTQLVCALLNLGVWFRWHERFNLVAFALSVLAAVPAVLGGLRFGWRR